MRSNLFRMILGIAFGSMSTAPSNAQAVGAPKAERQVERLSREAALPAEMQGRWVELEDPSSELIIEGSEIRCFGGTVAYDYKLIERIEGALTVTLEISNPADEDAFQRTNITGLVISPEGNFFAYNVKFVAEFVRPKS